MITTLVIPQELDDLIPVVQPSNSTTIWLITSAELLDASSSRMSCLKVDEVSVLVEVDTSYEVGFMSAERREALMDRVARIVERDWPLPDVFVDVTLIPAVGHQRPDQLSQLVIIENCAEVKALSAGLLTAAQ